jgi:hypothetical protein
MFRLSQYQGTEEKKLMASPLEIYYEWQQRQNARDVEHLGEVVDIEGRNEVVVCLHVKGTHVSEFLGVPAVVLMHKGDGCLFLPSCSRRP